MREQDIFRQQERVRTGHRRVTIYVTHALALCLGYALLRNSSWQGSKELHTLMETIATILALLVGILALIRFSARKDVTFLFIGSGFIGTAFLDGYHTIVTSIWFDQFFPSPPPHLIPWSWIASRTFLSVLLFSSWVAWRWEQKHWGEKRINDYMVHSCIALLTLSSFAFFALTPLPRAYYPELFFGRPEEFVPALFFLLALVGYLRKGKWKVDSFEHWLVLSLIVSVVTQMVFMSFSFHLFDFAFDAAHLLKKVSYIYVLIGLLVSVHYLFRQVEEGKIALQKQNVALRQAKEASESASSREQTLLIVKEKQTKEAMLSVMEDLDQAKQKAEKEAQNVRKFQQAVTSATDAIFITDQNGRIIYVNPAWEQLTGYTSTAVCGKNMDILRSDETPPEVYEELWQTISRGDAFHTEEIINRRKNGSTFDAELEIYPLSEKGVTLFYVGVQRDITHRKRADAAKSEFVSLASHQLRTPITIIRWALKRFKRKATQKLDRKEQHLLEEALKAAIRMTDTITAMLVISRLEAGRVHLNITDVLVRPVLSDVSRYCKESHHDKKLKFSLTCPKDLSLRTDKKLLTEILENLISNAFKYTPSGGSITVRAKKKGEHCQIDVQDTGYGIPAHQKKKIFTKFFRADNIIDKQTDGTGLGLYLVHALCGLLGGIASFTSEEDKGTTFSIALPLSAHAQSQKPHVS